jgi:CDP-glucose 4,6-dehydratase
VEGVVNTKFWTGKRVLLTGHTGFKGSWLTLWLATLGARVHGYALEPDTDPSLFRELRLERDIDHCVADIRDADAVRRRVTATRPEVVFHLAAQPLVRRSYAAPLLTWQTNVMGTVHLLDALRELDEACAVVIVTRTRCTRIGNGSMPTGKRIASVAMTPTARAKPHVNWLWEVGVIHSSPSIVRCGSPPVAPAT